MDNLESILQLKIKDIVEKLQKMECTLLGNKEDAWIMELLFNPGFHRYHLIEWILSKFNYNIKKITGLQNSPEGRLNNLLTAISSLGLYRKHSLEIIKGTAPLEEQLEFWYMLVDLLMLKFEITGNLSLTDDESVALPPEKTTRKAIYDEYAIPSACISNICSSVNLKNLFSHNIQLLAPDVQRETEQMSASKLQRADVHSLEKFKNLITQRNSSTDSKELFKTLLSQDGTALTETEEGLMHEDEMNKLENSMISINQQMQSCVTGAFNDVYSELKPLIIHASPEKFTDVGPFFQKVEQNLETVLELKESLTKLASSDFELQTTTSGLDCFSSYQKIADSKAINIAKLLDNEI